MINDGRKKDGYSPETNEPQLSGKGKRVPRSEWATTTADQTVIPATEIKKVRPDAGLWDPLEEMDRDGVNQLPVMVDGKIEGVLSREDLVSYLRTLSGLG
jgi:CBS domain-containing protein